MQGELDASEKKLIGKEVIKLKREKGTLQDQIGELQNSNRDLTLRMSRNNTPRPVSRMDNEGDDSEVNGSDCATEQNADDEVRSDLVEDKDDGREKMEKAKKPRPSSARSQASYKTYNSQPIQGINCYYLNEHRDIEYCS